MLALALAAASTACRQDMQNQPKYKPLHESEFFGDRRSARPQIEGTVARGHLRVDAARYTGKVGDNNVTAFPFPITRDDLTRGQERFNIYCTPCHGRIGDGNGMVVKRGFRQPPSYHIPRLKEIAVGHFFDVMTNGYGAMPSYASRVVPDDRWRIAAYIRALQVAQGASAVDVPAEEKQKLDAAPQQNPPNQQPQVTNGPPANPAAPAPSPKAEEKK
ncbi:MAG: cytochrome c [Acidobacteriota bacterium]|nr:cytochrome c [Acidobacteriota bacterium]